MNRRIISSLLVLLPVLLLSACGGGQNQNEFTVSVEDEFNYSPSVLTVSAGQEVTIILNNTSTLEHTFNVLKAGEEIEHVKEDVGDEEHLHEALIFDMHEVQPGESETASFTAPSEPGDYDIICVIPGHIDAGMVGTLRVEP